MKRRIFCLLIIVLMFSFPMSGYSEDTSSYDYEITLLSELNYLLNNESFNFQPEENISKAEFTAQMIKMLNLESQAVEVTPYTVFKDVPVDSWYASYVAMANQIGLVDGNGEGEFSPNSIITVEQAIKIMICALGYDQMANAKGGYPSGYLLVASDIGLIKSLSPKLGKEILQKEMAVMIYNALSVKLMQIHTISGSDVSYNISDASTLLTKRKIYKGNGLISSNSRTALTIGTTIVSESMLKENRVIINGIVFETGSTSASGLLGYNVNYYYQYDENLATNTLVYVEPNHSKSFRLESTEIKSATKTKYEYMYDNDDNMRTINISVDAYIIYNGHAVNNIRQEDFMPKNGNVIFVENSGDNKYDLVFINNYETIVVKSYVNNIIYDLYDPNKTLPLDEDDDSVELKIYDTAGVERNISYIKEWSVLMMAKAFNTETNKMICEITVSNMMVTGVVSVINDTDIEGEKLIEIKVDDRGFYSKKYYTSLTLPEEILLEIKEGVTIEFCLDIDGKVAAVKNYTSQDKFGFLFGASYKTLDGVRLKLFTENNKIEIVGCYKKVTVDGVKDLTNDAITNAISGRENQMIQYRINGRGEITTIDTLKENPEEFITEVVENVDPNLPPTETAVYNGFRKPTPSQWSSRYKSKAMTFSGRNNISASTAVFLIPADVTEENLFQYKTYKHFANDSDYKIEAYYNKYHQVRSPLVTIVASGSGNLGLNDYPEYVTKISRAANEDGEAGYKIYTYKGSNSSQFYVNQTAKFETKNISVGDAVRFTTNSRGEINYITKVLDVSEKTLYNNDVATAANHLMSGSTFSYTDGYWVSFGRALARTDDVVRIYNATQSIRDLSYIIGTSPVYVFDYDEVGDPEVKKGSIINIISEEQDIRHPVSLFFHMRYGEVITVYVIK